MGLTEKPAALLRWMVGGPEMARVIRQFVDGLDMAGKDISGNHEDTPGDFAK